MRGKHKKPHLLGKKVGKNNIKIMKKIRIWFFDALASNSDAKISIIFHSRHILEIFLNFFLDRYGRRDMIHPPISRVPRSRASNHCLAAMTS